MAKPRVYILNKGCHDYSAASRFGDIVFVTDGVLPKYSTNMMFRMLQPHIAVSEPHDYILISSLTILCVIAAAMFVSKHNCLNVLIFKDGEYISRRMVF